MKNIFLLKIVLANPIFVSENKSNVTGSYDKWKEKMLQRYNTKIPERKIREGLFNLSFSHTNFGRDHKFNLKKKMNWINSNFTGNYIIFTNRFQNNYGHVFHDHLPQISWILKNSKENIFLLNTKLNKMFSVCFFSNYINRLFFLNVDTQYFFNGKLSYFYLEKPRSYTAEKNNLLYHSAFLSVKQENICKTEAENLVIYCSRHPSQAKHGRIMDTQNENQIIRYLFERFGKKFVVFNGLNNKNEKMNLPQQAQLFSKASLVIGPHGSAMSNIGWMDWESKPAVIEFICTSESIQVQNGCPFYRTYYWMFGIQDEIKYYHIGFTKESTSKKLFVEIGDLKKAVDSIIFPKGTSTVGHA